MASRALLPTFSWVDAGGNLLVTLHCGSGSVEAQGNIAVEVAIKLVKYSGYEATMCVVSVPQVVVPDIEVVTMPGCSFTMRLAVWPLALLLLAGIPETGQGQEKPTRFFSEQGELKMELNADWKTILQPRNYDERYPARLTLQIPGEQSLSLDVELTTRGKSRKKRDLCRFPPLKIYFDKEQLKGTTLRGNKSLKLVTHCSGSVRFSSYYIKEFLIYRAYNEITPMSFRVRSARITYTDSLGKRKPDTHFAFFIEDVDDMAERNDLEEIVSGKIRPSRLDAQASSLYSVFQYMIGNLDWAALAGPNSAECCHNTKLIGIQGSDSPYYPVPYDFDVSGLVDAHYAVPSEALGVRNVTIRLYRGYCVHNHLTETSLETFRTKKDAILAVFSDDPRLDDRHKKITLKYLDKFFTLIDKPGASEKEFNRKCRG